MNSSSSLTSQSALQGPSLSPCIGLLSPNWMDGLFDTSGPEVAEWSDDFKVASEFSPFDVEAIAPTDLDLLSGLPGSEGSYLAEVLSPTDSEGNAFDNSFMEIFTDLNNIMKMAESVVTLEPGIDMGANVQVEPVIDMGAYVQVEPVIDMDANVQVEPHVEMEPTVQVNAISTSTSKRGRKRKATAAAVATSETTPTGKKDHIYSTKRNKPNYIEAASEETSDEEEVALPEVKKKQKYAERRRKNNIASQKSRQTRRKKNTAAEQQVEDLEDENQDMRTKIAEIEALTKELKELLVSQLAGVKK